MKRLSESACRSILRNGSLVNSFSNLKQLTADILAYRGHEDEAVEAYEKLIQLHPEMPELRYSLGMLYRKRAGWDKALEVFQELLAHDPKSEQIAGAVRERQHVQQDCLTSSNRE